MRSRFLLVFSMLFLTSSSWSQEVEHEHSIHHAFIENKGQWGDQVLFKSSFKGGNLWIEQGKMLFHLRDYENLHKAHVWENKKGSNEIPQAFLQVKFIGANPITDIEKSSPTSQYFNYFIGNNREKWASNVRGYGEASLKGLYPGIDLKLIEELEQLKYEFHVAPGANPNSIVLDYSGQKNIEIDKNGNLVVKTDLGEIIEQRPYSYQIINGNIREVESEFIINGSEVTFELGNYNTNVKLIIDPVLIFATYSGSVTDNFGMTATYGHDGTAYSGGMVYGNGYPVNGSNSFDTTSNFSGESSANYGITDVFITRYSADGANMIWTTFLGGGNDTIGTETAQSIICDEFNNVYVYGSTSSLDFPIQGGYQTVHAGGVLGANFNGNGVYFSDNGSDIYVAKISANGEDLLASTYFGGSANDGVNYQPSSLPYSGISNFVGLVKNYGDNFRGEIMLDNAGNCLVASCTRSNDFPVSNAFQGTNAGQQDGVIFKLNSDLSNVIWSSYYGGTLDDACYSVKVDSSDNIVIAGGTNSVDLSNTSGGWQSGFNGGGADGYVIKLAPNGLSINYGTYIGAVNYDQAFFVEVDRYDNVYLLGQTEGGVYPVINATYEIPGSSLFITKLNPTLSSALNSTVFGNGTTTANVSPSAFLVDICGNIYMSGWGGGLITGLPLDNMPVTVDAYQYNSPNNFDFYLFVMDKNFSSILYGTYLGGSDSQEHVDGGTSRFDKNGVVYQSVCGGCWANSDFPTTAGAWSNLNLSTGCNNVVFKFEFDLIPKAEFTIDDNLGCEPFLVQFENFSTASDTYLWDFGNGDTTSMIFEPLVTFDTTGIYTVYLYVTDSVCLLTDTAEITITVTDSLSLTTIPDQELCVPEAIDFIAYTNNSATTFIWSSNINFTDTLNTNLSDSVWTHTPSGPMTYYIHAVNAGCSGIDSVVIDFIGSSLILTANDSICVGEQTLITAENTNPAITFDYVWEPDSVIVTPSITNTVLVDPSVSQFIVVTATSLTGCVVTDSIQIFVGNVPDGSVIATASETYVAEGSTVQLIGEPSGFNYTWSPGQGVVNVNAQVTEAVVNQTTIYTLTVSDGICSKTDTTLVTTFDFICGDPYLYIPNAFSPNHDGENEVLYVRGALVEEMVFRIYDRWGEMVFESFKRTDGWDGTFRGKEMDPDTYDYYLEVTCIGGDEAIVKGNITLIR